MPVPVSSRSRYGIDNGNDNGNDNGSGKGAGNGGGGKELCMDRNDSSNASAAWVSTDSEAGQEAVAILLTLPAGTGTGGSVLSRLILDDCCIDCGSMQSIVQKVAERLRASEEREQEQQLARLQARKEAEAELAVMDVTEIDMDTAYHMHHHHQTQQQNKTQHRRQQRTHTHTQPCSPLRLVPLKHLSLSGNKLSCGGVKALCHLLNDGTQSQAEGRQDRIGRVGREGREGRGGMEEGKNNSSDGHVDSSGVATAAASNEGKHTQEYSYEPLVADRDRMSGSLVRLELDNNRIRDEGIQCLAAYLAGNRSLLHLSLNDNSISSVGAKALAEALTDTHTHASATQSTPTQNTHTPAQPQSQPQAQTRSNSVLINLNINNNYRIRESGMRALVHMAQSNFSLQSLSFDGKTLESEALTPLRLISLYGTATAEEGDR